MATDPVCNMEIDETDAEFQALCAGRKYSSARKSAKRNSKTDQKNTPLQALPRPRFFPACRARELFPAGYA
jgi:YHS domain-containing protein